MNLLEGSIAFALALAGFATICTVLIEILHRVLGMRADGMKKMLEGYFEDVIKPKLSDEQAKAVNKEALMDKLLTNTFLNQLGTEKTWWGKLLNPFHERLLKLNSVSTEDFLRRLPDTDLFEQLKKHSPNEAKAMVKYLADKYDQYGAGATDYFKRRAQLLSIFMGVMLALFANIHAVQLFDAFIKNPDLAQRMEAQASNIRQTLESQQPSTVPAPGPIPKVAPGPEPKAGQPGATQGAATQANSATKPIDYAEVKAELDKTIATLKSYQEMGLPIGWRYYPNCFGMDIKDTRCDKATKKATDQTTQEAHKKSDSKTPSCLIVSLWKTTENDFFGVLLWLFTVVLTGILIGLGGPFWFDLAVRLSQVRQAFTGKPALQPATGGAVVAMQSQPVSPRQQAIEDVSELLQPK